MPLIVAAAISAAGSIAGAMIGKQKAPKAATFNEIDPQAEQKNAIAGNQANEGDIEALLSRANSFTQDQANGMMEKALPGYAALSKKLMDTASSKLSNPYALPQDVQDNLQRIAAEKGIQTGINGQARDFSALRDLGLNELQYGNSNINEAQGILTTLGNIAPRVNPMSPASLYISPAQQISTIAQNNAGQYNAQQSNNNAVAAANNYNAAMWGQVVTKIGSTFAGAYGGMAGNAGSAVSSIQTG